MALKFIDNLASDFINKNDFTGMQQHVKTAHEMLHSKTGPGNDFLGWLELPVNFDKSELERIKSAAKRIQNDSDILIVIGIGGSYLGARAAIDFLRSPYYNALPKNTPDIYFAGNSISGSDLSNLLKICEGKRISVNVISKSGTTTEPAIAFRVFRDLLITRYGEAEAAKRIYCTTDKSKGTLKEMADACGYECFVIPDDVGGRFSVLTAVGLLPMAVSGIDIDAVLNGAAAALKAYASPDISNNDCYRYAAIRNIMYNKGKTVELLVSYEPRFTMMAEWFKQLFGESEGKDHKGLFPASVTFSTDLHSMGQYIQDGRRIMFETVVSINDTGDDITIKQETQDGDGLNFLAGKSLSFVNRKAFEGTLLAHTDGGVPCFVIEVDAVDEYNLGWMIYFFEKACAISGYILGVNPFDQPGVESYKKNMFALLGKPGFEQEREKLQSRLSNR